MDLRSMRILRLISMMVAAVLWLGTTSLVAQPSQWERFRAHNAEVAGLQPAMVTPLVAADPRLIQYVRLAASHEYAAAGNETVTYGNGRGAGTIAFRRFEFDVMPPPYIQHNSAARDGFGDASAAMKVRVASGNAEHGNFDVAASLVRCFATGSHTNGARTDSFTATVVGVKDVGRFTLESALGGTLPTGKIAAQGRTINWSPLVQLHAAHHVWFEVENNATFYFAGPHDGMMQNFITPAGFYVLRRDDWKPTHPIAVFATGMQIATSGFNTCNHNWISEVRVLF